MGLFYFLERVISSNFQVIRSVRTLFFISGAAGGGIRVEDVRPVPRVRFSGLRDVRDGARMHATLAREQSEIEK